jgi:hypothetical protein
MATYTFLPPLGKWNDLTKLHHDHEWYIATPRCLMQKRGNQWLLHQRQGRGNKFYKSRPSLIHYTPQLKSITKVIVHRTSIECIDDIDIIHSIPQYITFTCSWRKQYEILPSHIRRIIGPFPNPSHIIQYMHSRPPIRSVSDGSVLDCLGCQRWLVATLDNAILIQGFGATGGRVENTHSYRAELCGNITTLTILNIIRRIYGFTPRSIQHVCDNQSAITSTWKHGTLSVFDKTKPDADIIIVARVALSEFQLHSPGKPHWVASHSDKLGPPYTIQEELNILTYKLAEIAQTELPLNLRPRHDALHFPEQQISVIIA